MGGHKDFIRDLKSAQLCRIERVTDICRGDSDGEISFLYSHPGLPEPLQVLALAQGKTECPLGSILHPHNLPWIVRHIILS